MKSLILLCFVGILLRGGEQLYGQEILAFEDFYKQKMKTEQGVVPVYYDEQNVYIEIRHELLGRYWLLTAQIDRGAELINRNLPTTPIFSLEKGSNTTLELKRKSRPERVTNDSSALEGVLANSMLSPVYAEYEIVALSADKQGYIVDITPFLKENRNWFQFKNEQLNGEDISTTEILRIKSFEEGVQFSIRRQFEKGFSEGIVQASYAASFGQIPVEASCVLRLLPEKEMKIRPGDSRMGYETISYMDYGRNPYKAVRDSLIVRWRMEVATKDRATYQKGIKIKPKTPLVFYMDGDCPKEYLKPITEGVLQWNKAFEQAGFSKALEVKVLIDKKKAATLPALISFDMGTPGIKGEKIIDPVTGEILYCRINIGHGFLQADLTRYLLQCGNTDPRILKDRESPEISGNILKALIAREVGKILGLLPNHAGYSAYSMAQWQNSHFISQHGFTASVTGGPLWHYMATPTNRIHPNDLLARVGEQDKGMIEYGYRVFLQNKSLRDDRKSLDALWRVGAKRFNDLSGVQKNKLSPSASLKGMENALNNLEAVYARLENVCYGQKNSEDNGALLKSTHRKGMELYLEYMQQALTTNDLPLLLPFFDNRLFQAPPAWMTTIFLRENNIDIPESWLPGKMKPLFERLFSPEMLHVLTADSLGNNYTSKHFWKDIAQSLFRDFDDKTPLTDYQINVCKVAVDVLTGYIDKHSICLGESDYAVVMLPGLRMLACESERVSETHPDSLTAGFYKEISRKIRHKMGK